MDYAQKHPYSSVQRQGMITACHSRRARFSVQMYSSAYSIRRAEGAPSNRKGRGGTQRKIAGARSPRYLLSVRSRTPFRYAG
jgi:hypothetical protein